MQYIDTDARIAGTLSLTQNPIAFETREEFDEYRASLLDREYEWQGRKRSLPNEKLWDENPERFPCTMLPVAEINNPDGANWIINTFLYDTEVIEEN